MQQKHNILIRQYLIKYGLCQDDLAAILKVHKSTISKWLNNKELPEEKQLIIIKAIQKEGEKREH